MAHETAESQRPGTLTRVVVVGVAGSLGGGGLPLLWIGQALRPEHLAPSSPTTTTAPMSASSAAQKPGPNRRRPAVPSSAQSQPGARSAAGAGKRRKRPGTAMVTPPLIGLPWWKALSYTWRWFG
jgi:hypothetical protein